MKLNLYYKYKIKTFVIYISLFFLACSGGGGGGGNNNAGNGDLDISFGNDGVFLFDSEDIDVRKQRKLDIQRPNAKKRSLQERQELRDRERENLIEQTHYKNPLLEQKISNIRAQFDDNGLAIVTDNTRNKIVIGGTLEDADSVNIIIFRFLQDGTLDPEFSNGTPLEIETGGSMTVADIFIDTTSGNITVVGSDDSVNNQKDVVFIKVDSDGNQIDIDFIDVFGNNSDDDVAAADLDDNGNLVVALTNGGQITVIRVDVNDALDTTFSDDGIQQVSTGAATDVVVDGSNQIVVIGFQAGKSTIAKVLENGNLDPNFDGNSGNGNGIVELDVGAASILTSVVVDSNNDIFAVGVFADLVGIGQQVLAAKFNGDNGELDTTFSADGLFDFAVADGNSFDGATATFLDGNNFIVAGFTGNVNDNQAFITIIDQNGDINDNFGENGFFVSDDFANGGAGNESSDIFTAVTVDNQGNILGVGTSTIVPNDSDLVAAKISN